MIFRIPNSRTHQNPTINCSHIRIEMLESGGDMAKRKVEEDVPGAIGNVQMAKTNTGTAQLVPVRLGGHPGECVLNNERWNQYSVLICESYNFRRFCVRIPIFISRTMNLTRNSKFRFPRKTAAIFWKIFGNDAINFEVKALI